MERLEFFALYGFYYKSPWVRVVYGSMVPFSVVV